MFQPFAPIAPAPPHLETEREKKKENLIDFCQEGNERGSEERQIDKVWPFFTGVIIDAEPTRPGRYGPKSPSICLAVTQTVGQNRTGERRDLWSGVAPVALEEEEGKKVRYRCCRRASGRTSH